METSLVTIKARIAEDESDRRQGPRLPVVLVAQLRVLGACVVEALVVFI